MLRRTLLTVLFLLCSACAALAPVPRPFETVQRDYAERVRWRDFSGAARYMQSELGEDFRRHFAALTDLNITGVRLDSAEYAADGKRVHTWNTIEYFLLPSTAVKTFPFEQTWEVVGGDRWHAGTWQIVTPFPPFPDEPSPGRK
jgi:hypothetical protein